jgi:hypothetical protein
MKIYNEGPASPEIVEYGPTTVTISKEFFEELRNQRDKWRTLLFPLVSEWSHTQPQLGGAFELTPERLREVQTYYLHLAFPDKDIGAILDAVPKPTRAESQ